MLSSGWYSETALPFGHHTVGITYLQKEGVCVRERERKEGKEKAGVREWGGEVMGKKTICRPIFLGSVTCCSVNSILTPSRPEGGSHWAGRQPRQHSNRRDHLWSGWDALKGCAVRVDSSTKEKGRSRSSGISVVPCL